MQSIKFTIQSLPKITRTSNEFHHRNNIFHLNNQRLNIEKNHPIF